jgi:hypothetical protein
LHAALDLRTPARFSRASSAITAVAPRMFGSMSSVGALVAVILFYLLVRRVGLDHRQAQTFATYSASTYAIDVDRVCSC